MSWKPYPKYKPSEVEWIGDVPGHWETVPLKGTFQIFNGSTPKSGEPSYWDGEIAPSAVFSMIDEFSQIVAEIV